MVGFGEEFVLVGFVVEGVVIGFYWFLIVIVLGVVEDEVFGQGGVVLDVCVVGVEGKMVVDEEFCEDIVVDVGIVVF